MQLTPRLVMFSLAGLAVTQDISQLPSCASAGAFQAITASGCSSSDIACICKSSAFTTGLQSYAKANCSPQDYATAITVGQTLCAQAGVTLTTASPSTSATTSSTLSASTPSDGGTATESTASDSVTSTSTPTTASPTDTVVTASRDANATVLTTTRCSCVTEVYTIPAVPTTSTPPIATFTGAAGASGGKRDGVGLIAGLLGVVGLIFV